MLTYIVTKHFSGYALAMFYFKGAAKLHFLFYLCMVIILFITDLSKFAISFKKQAFRLSVFCVFCLFCY